MPRSSTPLLSRRWRIFAAIAPLAFFADQLTKYWARATLPPSGARISVIDHYFDWSLSTNTGSAFSVVHGPTAMVVLSAFGAVALAAVLWLVHRSRDDRTLTTVALSAIAGGAAGNLFDRVVSGGVTDFILWRYHDHLWPTFNLADAFLLVGVLFLLVDSLHRPRQPNHLDPAPTP